MDMKSVFGLVYGPILFVEVSLKTSDLYSVMYLMRQNILLSVSRDLTIYSQLNVMYRNRK